MTSHEHGGNVFAVARHLGVSPEELLDFSASINPLGMPVAVREAIISGVDRLVHYPDAYAQPLREALAEHHSLEPSQITVSNGTTELIYLLPRLLPGERALIIAPAFSEYANALTAAGWDVKYHSLSAEDGFTLDLASLEKRLSEGFDLLFFCNPGNPTGRLYSRDEIGAVANICIRCGTLMVLDEAFIDFCEEEASMVANFVSASKGIVLRSMTKFYAIPGLRLGYAAASEGLSARLATLRGPWSVNVLAQDAGMAALSDTDFRRRSIIQVSVERENLRERLSAIPGLKVFKGGANYLLLKLLRGKSAACVREELLFHRILIRDCSSFHGLDGRFIRVAVRSAGENIRLTASIAEILGKA